MKRHNNKTIMINRNNIKVEKGRKKRHWQKLKREKVTFKEIT